MTGGGNLWSVLWWCQLTTLIHKTDHNKWYLWHHPAIITTLPATLNMLILKFTILPNDNYVVINCKIRSVLEHCSHIIHCKNNWNIIWRIHLILFLWLDCKNCLENDTAISIICKIHKNKSPYADVKRLLLKDQIFMVRATSLKQYLKACYYIIKNVLWNSNIWFRIWIFFQYHKTRCLKLLFRHEKYADWKFLHEFCLQRLHILKNGNRYDTYQKLRDTYSMWTCFFIFGPDYDSIH